MPLQMRIESYTVPDFRYQTLLGNATQEFHAMSTYAEKVGAHRMLSLLTSHLTNSQKAKDHMTLNSVLSTIAKLEKNLFQDLLTLSRPPAARASQL